MISKTIYQTWSTQQLPNKLEKLHDKMRKKNPNFEHVIYTDEQMNDYMNSNVDKEIKNIYWKMNHIVAKADLWRYSILYNKGGVYLDIDSQISGSLSDLINDDDNAIITPEIHENLFIQWGLIFGERHKILEKTLENILKDVVEENNKYDHHALTVRNYAKAILELAENHKCEFKWNEPKLQKDKTYIIGDSSFRVVGTDYKNLFSFKHKYNHLLRNRPKGTEVDTHWSRYDGPIY